MNDTCSDSTGRTALGPQDIRNSLDQTIQTTKVLRKVRDSLMMTLRAYNRFDEPGGDKSYFSDMQDYSPGPKDISNQLRKLADLELRLRSLDESCERFATYVSQTFHAFRIRTNQRSSSSAS